MDIVELDVKRFVTDFKEKIQEVNYNRDQIRSMGLTLGDIGKLKRQPIAPHDTEEMIIDRFDLDIDLIEKLAMVIDVSLNDYQKGNESINIVKNIPKKQTDIKKSVDISTQNVDAYKNTIEKLKEQLKDAKSENKEFLELKKENQYLNKQLEKFKSLLSITDNDNAEYVLFNPEHINKHYADFMLRKNQTYIYEDDKKIYVIESCYEIKKEMTNNE